MKLLTRGTWKRNADNRLVCEHDVPYGSANGCAECEQMDRAERNQSTFMSVVALGIAGLFLMAVGFGLSLLHWW